jgi:hypothetical protein
MQDRVVATEAEMIPIAQVMERLGDPVSVHRLLDVVDHHPAMVRASPPSRV